MDELNPKAAKVEALMDEVGLPTLLTLMATIADAKSEHIATAWQDESGSRDWKKAANKLAVTALYIKTMCKGVA